MNQPLNAPKPPFKLTPAQRISEAWIAMRSQLQAGR